jgi:hypothetical protein
MAETAPAPDVAQTLMRVLDEQVGHLRGAVAAADAICDLLFDQAEQNGAVYSTNRGLRWALEEATAAVEAEQGPAHGPPAGAGAGGRGAAADVVAALPAADPAAMRGRSTLMSRFNSRGHGCSSPIRSEAGCPPDDRAWQGAAAETTVEQTLMRGLATAGPRFVSGLLGLGAGRR